MIYIYNILKIYDYVCTHQKGIADVITNDNVNLFDSQVLSPLVIERTCATLAESKSNPILVWDLRKTILDDAGRQLIDVLVPIKEKNYKGICFLADSKDNEIFSRINLAAKDYCSDKSDTYETFVLNESCCYCGEKGVYNSNLKDHVDGQNLFTVVDNDINHQIFEYLKSDSERQWKQNPSSNIYVNQYFDAKKMLTNAAIYNLIVYRMALMIRKSLSIFKSDHDFDAFVCASLTGSCLASGLAAIFHKPIVYLKNVGPSITANDERLIARIKKNKRYVFVFDFMCLGKEYERIKLICNLRSAKVICCSGISYYRLPRFRDIDPKEGEFENVCFDWNEELYISSLFKINAFDETYYACCVDEQ